MYLDFSSVRYHGKVYRRVLLRESYRDHGRVRKRTLANLSHVPEATIRALHWALHHPDQVPPTGSTGAVELRQGPSVGALAVLTTVAQRLGVSGALGADRSGRLALYQVCARALTQGSRLSAVRLARTQPVGELLDLGRFNEDTLYANLEWLASRQAVIEDELWRQRVPAAKRGGGLFLYDVTSTYLEGQDNELAAFGYNRDGKHGKKQIVVGLLTDADGEPLSIELFPGNTADPSTVASQVEKLRARFGGGALTLVGDRGMLKLPQQRQLQAEGWHYITAITKAQIEALLRRGCFQMELFDQALGDVNEPDSRVRYILRRNPAQARLVAARRADQLATWQTHLKRWQDRLKDRPRTRPATAIKELTARAQRLRLAPWLSVRADGRTLTAAVDETARAEVAKLDGCYALQTDLAPAQLSAAAVDARYHDLAHVEWAFRTCKTAFLEIRPVYLRKEARTRGHAFVVMLAYRLTRHLADCWRNLDLTVEEGLEQLLQLCAMEVRVAGQPLAQRVPEPRANVAELLTAARVTLPTLLPPQPSAVDTSRKLQSRRKKL